jgi:hypothetical protein
MTSRILAAVFVGVFGVLSQNADAHPMTQQNCSRVLVVNEDSKQRQMGERLGDIACRQLKRLESEFQTRLHSSVRIRILATMDDWHARVGKPWYVVAVSLHDQILTQPASSLRKIDSLERLIAHEIVHMFTRQVIGYACPRWLDEGLAQFLTGYRKRVPLPCSEKELVDLERRLLSRYLDRNELRTSYDQSLALVEKLIDQIGKRDFLAGMRKLRGKENILEIELEAKTIRQRLFKTNKK